MVRDLVDGQGIISPAKPEEKGDFVPLFAESETLRGRGLLLAIEVKTRGKHLS